ncbi:hypothetical protein [Pseudidiomarina donghaiensis]
MTGSNTPTTNVQLRALAQLVQQRCRYFREQASLFTEVQRNAF